MFVFDVSVGKVYSSELLALKGRNDFSIFVISRELGILTWDEAFLSLRSTLLPDSLRAKYCELIIGKLMRQ